MKNAEIIKHFFEEDEWHYECEEKENVVIFTTGVKIHGKLSRCDVTIACRDEQIVSYANIGINADVKHRAQVAEFITRVNYEFANLSRFEMDFEDGEVRTYYAVDCDGNMELSEKVIEGIVCCPADIFEQCGEALLDVMFGYATAAEACERLKQQSEIE